jgi:DNA-binding beta-propeller fold protein YncE
VTALALLGLSPFLQGSGPAPVIGAAAAAVPVVVPGAVAPAPAPVRFQTARLVYRQIEGLLLKGPRGVFVDRRRGEVYVADTMNDLVCVYDLKGVPLFAFGYNGEFKEPVKAVVDGVGRIYVLAGVGGRVRVFSYRGEFLHDFAFPGLSGQTRPTALTADDEGNIYIADDVSGSILVYDSEQHLRLKLGGGRSGNVRFETVQAIAVAAGGDIYVAQAQGVPIQIFSPEGKYLRGWGEHSAGPQNFSLPSGLAVDAEGRLIVVDRIRNAIVVFAPDGAFLGRYGGLGFAPGAVAFPSDVATDGGNRIYVVERVGNRLQILDEQVVPVARRRRGGSAGGSGNGGGAPVPSKEREELKRSLGDILRRNSQ